MSGRPSLRIAFTSMAYGLPQARHRRGARADGVGADSDNAIAAALEPDLRARVQRRRPRRRLRRHVVALLLVVIRVLLF